jgi:WD40 repeat protein
MADTDTPEFLYDVLISHHSIDNGKAQELAERLVGRNEQVRVVLTSEVARNTNELNTVLDRSQVLILLVSRHGAGSPLLPPEQQAHLFLDPAEPERRFSLICLDETLLPESLNLITPISSWATSVSPEVNRHCKVISSPIQQVPPVSRLRLQAVLRGHPNDVVSVALSHDGRRAVSGGLDGTVKVWDVEGRACVASLRGHQRYVLGVALSADGRRAISGGSDGTVKVWDVERRTFLASLQGHDNYVRDLALSADGRRAVSCSDDGTVKVWDVEGRACLASLRGHRDWVLGVAMSADGLRAVSCSRDGTVKVWDVGGRTCLGSLQGHTGDVSGVALSADGRRAVSCADDGTVKVWDVEGRICLASFQGHEDWVLGVAMSADGLRAVSCSRDGMVKVWDVEGRACLASLQGHTGDVSGVAMSADGLRAVSGGDDGIVRVWDLSQLSADDIPSVAVYASAKVLLTGNSGVGKSGLAHRMVHGKLIPTISTDAVWATILPIPQMAEPATGVEREIWLWDFAGQADYRLIHQLYMDGTDVAVLVFIVSPIGKIL